VFKWGKKNLVSNKIVQISAFNYFQELGLVLKWEKNNLLTDKIVQISAFDYF